jgi:hypothetical protein
MKGNTRRILAAAIAAQTLPGVRLARATVTEHLNFAIVPAPGKVEVDGLIGDWDLSAGIFACGDVENQRDKYGVWFHAMWDAENLYVLARWHDLTPLNNPGSIKGDYGFNGDCLQFRVLTAPADKLAAAATRDGAHDRNPDLPGTRTSHITAWRDRDNLDVVQIDWGWKFNEGGVDAKERGGRQAFRVRDDGRGYTQELAIPWTLLSRDGWQPRAGERIVMTIEPNFLTGAGSRLTIKDLFRPGVGIDRVFTFQGPNCWGFASLETKGNLEPRPVRLADGREFPVRLADGLPRVDWSGLVKSREPEGFKPIRFAIEEDGYVSLNIFRADGSVARQLLTSAFYPKGEHEVRWDGLGTMSARVPGQPLAAGEYVWGGIWQPGVSLRLQGWAGSTSATPWGRVWGGDHGNPCAAAADGERIYLGWSGGEGTQPLQAVTPDGKILWKQIRGGIATASHIAADGGTVYVWNEHGQYAPRSLYRVDARTGGYTTWEATGGTDLLLSQVFAGQAVVPNAPSGVAAGGGKVFMAFGGDVGRVAVIDAKTGKTLRFLDVPKAGSVAFGPDGMLYAVSFADNGSHILAVDPERGAIRRLATVALEDKEWIRALAVDADGDLYCGIAGGRHFVQVLDAKGEAVRAIGHKPGRRLSGRWQQDGMLNISGLAIDGAGRLWVAEDDGQPRRVSVWHAKTGAFAREFFGAATYGALGGAINPDDPSLMAGQGVEWRLDPETGIGVPLGTITRSGMMASRFGHGPGGRLYLATTPGFLSAWHPVRIFEKIADGEWKFRTMLSVIEEEGEKRVRIWADENDDQREQPGEIRTYPNDLGAWVQGWYMAMTQDLTFYGGMRRIAVTGWTACGAPQYDLTRATRMPSPGGGRGGMGAQANHGSADGRYVLWNGAYGVDHSTFDCFEIDSGRLLWTYPNNFTGVHGSHRAPPPEPGMIRGAFDIVGSVKLPDPIGNIWVIGTNKGEWHALTEKGYYLTRFWEGDVMKQEFPERASPGTDVSRCPPGAAEEAFGGSITLTTDGRFFLQGGHTSFWNVEVRGLERARPLAGGALTLSAADVATAGSYRERYLDIRKGERRIAVVRATPTFTGDIAADFGAANIRRFARQDNAGVRAALAWDDDNLYAAWEVEDETPWLNGADAPQYLYARGDTVDLQLGTDPAADPKRTKAEAGDLRLSIGPFQGKPTAVIYRRKVAEGEEKRPMSFSSGVYDNHVEEHVAVLDEVRIVVKTAPDGKSYTVEAAIPWRTLGAKPRAGLVLRGDLGVTHGNRAGNDTVLRSYWANLDTGLVSDEVGELMVEPDRWGEFELK